MNVRRLALGLISLALIGCADLKDLLSLQQGLSQEFAPSAINVNLNNSAYLTVMFSNSPVADLPEVERAAVARRVAEYVRDHYAHYDQLQSIQVGFAKVKGVGITFTSTQIPYQFTPSELGPPRLPKGAQKVTILPGDGPCTSAS
jgi:hypothetical protein